MRFPDEGSGVTPAIADQHCRPERPLQPVNGTGGFAVEREDRAVWFRKWPQGSLPRHPSGSAAGRKHFSQAREPRRPTSPTTTPACDRLMTGRVLPRCRFGDAHVGLGPSWVTRTWSTNAAIASSVASASSSCGECPAPASMTTSTGQVASASAAWICAIVP